MPDSLDKTCERCGRQAPDRNVWMVHSWDWEWIVLLGSPIRREFCCHRCRRIMRIYAAIGLSLFALVILAIIALTIWASTSP